MKQKYLVGFIFSLVSIGFAGATQADQKDEWVQSLTKTFLKYPSSSLTADPEHLRKAMQLSSVSHSDELMSFLQKDPNQWIDLRTRAAEVYHQSNLKLRPERHAYVSGLSIGGMVATAILAKAGYRVHAFERRKDYTRNIQWAGRQALIDALSALDKNLAERFRKETASMIPKGTLLITDQFKEGDSSELRAREVRQKAQPIPKEGNMTRIPLTGSAMLAEKSAVIIECRVFEKLMLEYFKTLPHVSFHPEETIQFVGPDHEGRYSVRSKDGEAFFTPDLIVITEGPNSSSRESLGIRAIPTSPPRLQIAGVLEEGLGGVMTKHVRFEKNKSGKIEKLITGIMARNGSNRTWVVADISDTKEHLKNVDADPRKVMEEFQRVSGPSFVISREAGTADPSGQPVTRSIELSDSKVQSDIASIQINGSVDQTLPKLFVLQQRISTSAVAGTNLIGLGDFVGNAHWSVGGGMQLAAISHAESLKKLLFAIEQGVDPKMALKTYNDAVMRDTLVWGKLGIGLFYPDIKEEIIADLFMRAVDQWRDLPRKGRSGPSLPWVPAPLFTQGLEVFQHGGGLPDQNQIFNEEITPWSILENLVASVI